jgi:hypothetical protein
MAHMSMLINVKRSKKWDHRIGDKFLLPLETVPFRKWFLRIITSEKHGKDKRIISLFLKDCFNGSNLTIDANEKNALRLRHSHSTDDR